MKKLTEGDIFNIPIDENEVGYGQIVKIKSHNFLMIVFKGLWRKNEDINISEIVSNEVLFMGYSIDAKLYHNHWKIVGSYTENLDKIELPLFRLGTPPDEIYILDHKGDKIRKCSVDEFELLDYQKIISPVRYEKALKAFYNKDHWHDDYEVLKVDNLLLGKRTLNV